MAERELNLVNPCKQLKLLNPQQASRLGLIAETPVLISTFIRDTEVCCECGVKYGPLMYQTGTRTTSAHFHEDRGGIYFTRGISHFINKFGFFAFVEPVGVLASEPDKTFRSEAVVVTMVESHCGSCQRQIREGFVCSIGECAEPFCYDHVSSRRPEWFFKIEEGNLLFSPME